MRKVVVYKEDRVAGNGRPVDGRADATAQSLCTAGHPLEWMAMADVYIVEGVGGFSDAFAEELFLDPVSQRWVERDDPIDRLGWHVVTEVSYRPGVANPEATSIRDALKSEFSSLPDTAVIQTAKQYFIRVQEHTPYGESMPEATQAAAKNAVGALYNPLIEQAVTLTGEQWRSGERFPESYPVVDESDVPPVQRFAVSSMNDAELNELSRRRLLALNEAELGAIRAHYASPEVLQQREAVAIGADATDVELEIIAQTWSEHCKHKIFAALVEYREGDGEPVEIDSVFKTYIRSTTERVSKVRDFLRSVFDDDSGVIAFDKETLLCFKAETHNSPSALDPYGGAITGIVGVNRDIFGTGKGARPLFNTNVLCFGYPDTSSDALPDGLLHPRVVLGGVHRGIVDGGNQSGIPVAAGGFLFDESYAGKPLVFCGTGGVLPAQIDGEGAWIKHIDPGDLAVMVGGRIGKDGIHGATFSSLALDDASPTSAVQIGEPITQKKMGDFLLEARDLGLYRGITDNGAGGLSSSLGEMAESSGGIDVDLDACPLKYHGLAAWEIFLSESQERMSLAVSGTRIEEFLGLAAQRGVEAAVVGQFTDDGLLTVRHQGEVVARIDLGFLHYGAPQMRVQAHWTGPRGGDYGGSRTTTPPDASQITNGRQTTDSTPATELTPGAVEIHDTLLDLLSDPNIGSKEHLIRRYDHEVQGGSIVKPFCGVHADGPTDGAVLQPRYDSTQGVTVTHGICPRYGDVDTYHMASAAVDEAVRAHVALGGDPDQMAALDNFCWPDPVLSDSTPDGPYKMAQLVRACQGLADACTAYSLPLISGKDSMKNDAVLGGKKVSIRPTLLVSLMGIIPDVHLAQTTSFKAHGDAILLIGSHQVQLGGTSYERLHGHPLGDCPTTDAAGNIVLYRRLHQAIRQNLLASIHDLADGGLAVAVAESAVAGRFGATISLPPSIAGTGVGIASDRDVVRWLFGESTGTFVATCKPASVAALTEMLGGDRCVCIGEVTTGALTIQPSSDQGGAVVWSLDEIVAAWKSFGVASGADVSPRTIATAQHRETAQSKPTLGEAEAPGSVAPSVANALLVTGYGINADRELAEALSRAGAEVATIHVNDLLERPERVHDAHILAFPGGFSYGDHVGSGMMLAHRFRSIKKELNAFRDAGRLIIGICNGFQVLVKMGILPDSNGDWQRTATLTHNASGEFEDSWVTVTTNPGNTSPWLRGLATFDMPIRHGEGRFMTISDSVRQEIEDQNLVAFRYAGRNPNGSEGDVAGITDWTGMVLGLMPHPEAYLFAQNHPLWPEGDGDPGPAARLFRNAVECVTRG